MDAEIKELESFRDAENHIRQAISGLSKSEKVLKEVCEDIKKDVGFDFVGISLVSAEQNTIEAIDGIGIASEWSGRAKHSLEWDPSLRDIQADIVLTGNAEVISGLDDRFDPWIYKEFAHDKIVRVYIPIVLIQQDNGMVVPDWFEFCQVWETPCINASEGHRQIFNIDFPSYSKGNRHVIGTIEAGYLTRERQIGLRDIEKLLEVLSPRVLKIWETQLPWVLQVIADNARQMMRAHAVTLHFLYEPESNKYIHQVFSGDLGRKFLKDCPPRRNGLGWQAIQEKTYKYIPESEQVTQGKSIENINPCAYRAGVKALAAFPLLIDDMILSSEMLSVDLSRREKLWKKGVLYVSFQEHHVFTGEELKLSVLFASRAVEAIQQATIYQNTRNNARRLSHLHSVTRSLADMPDKDDLLRRIAWESLNALAADIVTVYVYLEAEKQFVTPPSIAGRLKIAQEMCKEIHEQDIPFKLIAHGASIYPEDDARKSVFQSNKLLPFAQREQIKSAAGILLQVGQEVVGTLFINYRHVHDFPEEEKKIIQILASSAAIAIKNQRWFEAVSEIEREIIATTDQQQLLSLIARKVVQITNAHLGEIRLLDLSTKKLEMKAIYPEDTEVNKDWNSTSIENGGEGITGWVANQLTSRLVTDVDIEPLYKPFLPGAKAELCVPFTSSDIGLLGVLNVESRHKNAFDQKDQQRLEALANQVVIVLKKAQIKEQEAAKEQSDLLENIARSVFHRISNNLGNAEKWANQGANETDEEGSRALFRKIQFKILQMREDQKRIRSWLGARQLVDISETLRSVLDKISLPANIERELNIEESLPKIIVSLERLEDVFFNLIQNAIDAMPTGGKLSINAGMLQMDHGSAWLIVQFIDTGIGISKEKHETIFKLKETTKIDHGGEGLWLAKTYIKNIGGTIKLIDSKIGQGSTFSVLIPIHWVRVSQR